MHKVFKTFSKVQSLSKIRHFSNGVVKRTNVLLPTIAFGFIGAVTWKTLVKPVFAEATVTKTTPQATVTTGNHPQCGILVITLKNSSDFEEFVKAASKLPHIVSSLSSNTVFDGDELPELMAGVGFDAATWKEYVTKKGLKVPEGLAPYKARCGKFGDLPHTKHEIILHVKASTRSLCYETIDEFLKVLPKNKIASFQDYYGWQYKDGRDLSGFLDGTMNTTGDDERFEASVNSNGGSFLIHQRWEHNLEFLDSMKVPDQENLIGRKKDWSAEQDEKNMLATAHVKRMRDEKFQRIPIVRQSMPFGSIGHKRGLLFIAYSNNVTKFDTMLDRMTDSHSDAVMKYSKCVDGNYYYIPSVTELKSFAK